MNNSIAFQAVSIAVMIDGTIQTFRVNSQITDAKIFEVSAGTDDPVSINCPNASRWSTSNRMASHNFGANCHSSIKRGASPFSNLEGFNSANSIFCQTFSESCMYKILLANCDAVVVFPHHLAPSINTAPLLSSFSRKILSTILVLYCFIPYIKNKNRHFGRKSFGSLVKRKNSYAKYKIGIEFKYINEVILFEK